MKNTYPLLVLLIVYLSVLLSCTIFIIGRADDVEHEIKAEPNTEINIDSIKILNKTIKDK